MLHLRDLLPIGFHGPAALCLALTVVRGALLVHAGDVPSSHMTQRPIESGPSPQAVDVKRGGELYKASCSVCHGPRAEGGVGPKLAANSVLSNDQVFLKIVHEGRHVMPPLKGNVSDQQLSDIRAWIRTLP